jgi:hypothetical protein
MKAPNASGVVCAVSPPRGDDLLLHVGHCEHALKIRVQFGNQFARRPRRHEQAEPQRRDTR